MDDPGRSDDGLGGSAPEVHAGAAKILAFGQRDGHPFRRHFVGKGYACLSSTHYKDVVSTGVIHGPPSRSYWE
jgi:hypothetical protein